MSGTQRQAVTFGMACEAQARRERERMVRPAGVCPKCQATFVHGHCWFCAQGIPVNRGSGAGR